MAEAAVLHCGDKVRSRAGYNILETERITFLRRRYLRAPSSTCPSFSPRRFSLHEILRRMHALQNFCETTERRAKSVVFYRANPFVSVWSENISSGLAELPVPSEAAFRDVLMRIITEDVRVTKLTYLTISKCVKINLISNNYLLYD